MGFGGSSGSQTVVQSNTPWNANYLQGIDQETQRLYQDNPITYTPYSTYAAPNDLMNTSLGNLGGTALSAGNQTSGQMGGLQANAMGQNTNLINGGFLNNEMPFIGQMANLGQNNPAAGAMNTLGGYNLSNPVYQSLYNPQGTGAGQLVTQIGQGALQPSAQINALMNPYSFGGAPQLGALANGGYLNAAQPFMAGLSGAGINGPGAQALNQYANGGAQAAVSPYAMGSAAFGGMAPGMVSPYASGLAGIASGGPAANSLAATAQGAYLGANPYLNSMFQAAANPVLNAYQTATAPTIESQFNGANRLGSGANFVAQSTAQQNLGKTLADLQANIYGPAYQAERTNMVNAGNALGNLQTNALGTGGQLTNQALQNAIYGMGTGGQLAGAGTNAAINAANAAGGLNVQGLNSALQGYNTGVGQIGNAAQNLFSGGLGAVGSAGQLLNQAGATQAGAAANLLNNQTQGAANAINAANQAAYNQGQLGITGQQQQLNDWLGALGGYNTGVGQIANAIQQAPNLSQMPLQDLMSAYSTGQEAQGNAQAALNDINQRFMGTQLAPWQTLQMGAGIIGNPITGVQTTQSPMYNNSMQSIGGALGGIGSALGGAARLAAK